MTFNSSSFFIFFIIISAFQFLPLSWKSKKAGFLFASYVFYAAWNPPFVLLLWFSTVIDWLAARWMVRSAGSRKPFLYLSLLVNLGLLVFFKYGNFLLINFAAFLQAAGVNYVPARMDIVLPIGISFYTFQTLSYTLDVYRGKLDPCPSILDYALYVTFFPQLVSGPIVRAGEFLPQCAIPRKATADKFFWGSALLVFGLFQKEIMADYLLAPIVEKVFNAPSLGFVDAWAGTLAFSCQIFFDFSGYSTCAAGVALCLGFSLPANFRFPYGAAGFSDFWRRWHISLSSWFRDYVYIPLGGNSGGETRTWLNLAFTMLVCGLWHGASWSFVVWGGCHGSFLIAERFVRKFVIKQPAGERREGGLLYALFTFAIVSIAWVFFRADTLPRALSILSAMFSPAAASLLLHSRQTTTALAVAAGLFFIHRTFRDKSAERIIERIPWWALGVALSAAIVVILLAPGDDRAFIYFQF